MSEIRDELRELYLFLCENYSEKKFGLRNGYIYSGFVRKIDFEFFLRNQKIGFKYPTPNISENKIKSLDNMILQLDEKFVHRSYNTSSKSKYHIWELSIINLNHKEVVDLIKKFENTYE